MCVMRTAVSTLFTFWPPLPPERNVSTENSFGGMTISLVALLDFRNHVHAGKTRVAAFVGIERRDAHEAMHAAFGLA